MNSKDRFRCPACDFAVFNRRVPRCERCATALPASLMFTNEEIAMLAEEAARNDKIRQDMAREAEEIEAKQQRDQADGGY